MLEIFPVSFTANRSVETPNTELPAAPGEELASALSSHFGFSIISAAPSMSPAVMYPGLLPVENDSFAYTCCLTLPPAVLAVLQTRSPKKATQSSLPERGRWEQHTKS